MAAMAVQRGWSPKIFGLQHRIYDTRKSIVLADGSRASGKTIAVCHKVIRHMTETPGAEVGAFATTIKAAKDCGSWQLLHQMIIPEWLEANLRTQRHQPIQYLSKSWEGEPGPKRDSITRTEYFEWRNFHDGKSKCSLFSIDNLDDIASIVKQKQFSMVWMIELSTFKSKKVLQYTLPCLRMKHLVKYDGTPQNYHQWIADTNPDEEEGSQSWVYKFFYQDRNNPPLDLPGDSEEVLEDKKQQREWLADTDVIWMHWKDNPHASKKLIANIRFGCQGDQALLDSHVNGVWGEGGVKKEKHFAHCFIRSKHVIGEGEADQIAVSKNSARLYGGWDMGNVNHGSVIADKWFRLVKGQETSHWSILAEKVFIGEEMTLAAFTLEFLSIMESIEATSGKKFDWIHWSDDSAINVFRPTTGSFDYLEVMAASKGRIHLQGVNKPNGSVRVRVRILRQLLREDRIWVSACCPHVIAMLENLKKSEKEYVVRDEHVHIFDALTYVLYSEMQEELFNDSFKPTTVSEAAGEAGEAGEAREGEEESGVVSV